MELSEYERKAIHKFGESLHLNKWTNEGMVQIIELAASYLNAESISDYAKRTGMSYNGVKNNRETITILNQKFVIDNN